MISSDTQLWQYLSSDQRQLAQDGAALVNDRMLHPADDLSDYSYLVFPFAKLYEGFLKDVFLDMGFITEKAYRSSHFRIGKVLSPNLKRRLGPRSAYAMLEKQHGEELADSSWQIWKQGRNLVFHYFPHNIRRLSFEQARELIDKITAVMEHLVKATGVASKKRHLA